MPAKGFSSEEVAHAFSRACELARKLNDQNQLFSALQGVWGFHYTRGDIEAAQKVAEEAMAVAQNLGGRDVMKAAHYNLGATLQQTGSVIAARQHLEKALSASDASPVAQEAPRFGPDSTVLCLTSLSDALFTLGYPDQSLDRANEAMACVNREADPFSYAMALLFVVQAHCARREVDKGKSLCLDLIRLCTEHGFPFWLAIAIRCLAWATALQGRFAECVTMMNQQIRETPATDQLDIFNLLPMLAEAYGNLGEFDRGNAALDRWLEVRRSCSVSGMDKFYYRVRGELLLKAGSLEAAEENLRKAIQQCSSQSAKLEQLRSTKSLARLLDQQGRRDEARAMLAEIYGWFTEGFDVADLKEAKAQLDQLTV